MIKNLIASVLLAVGLASLAYAASTSLDELAELVVFFAEDSES